MQKSAAKQSIVRAAGIVCEDLLSGTITCLPVDYLGLSLGPTATFHYPKPSSAYYTIKDRLSIGLPVPYQTIATGLSAQVLSRIVDRSKTINLPFTGMKQTHFVEIGRTESHVLMKLTCGGVIGLPVHSRSYGISSLASLLRVIGPGTGLEFEGCGLRMAVQPRDQFSKQRTGRPAGRQCGMQIRRGRNWHVQDGYQCPIDAGSAATRLETAVSSPFG
jgi:hypothetical protein